MLATWVKTLYRRSENRAQVTYRASLGKPIVSVEVERRSLENLYRISMHVRHLISMQKIQIIMREIQNGAYLSA